MAYRLYYPELAAADPEAAFQEVLAEERAAQGIAGIGDKHRMQEKWAKEFFGGSDMRSILGALEAAEKWYAEYEKWWVPYLRKYGVEGTAGLSGMERTTGQGLGFIPLTAALTAAGMGLKVTGLVQGLSAKSKQATLTKNVARVKGRIKDHMTDFNRRVNVLLNQMERLGISALPSCSAGYFSAMKDRALKQIGKYGKDKEMQNWHRIKGVGKVAEWIATRLADVTPDRVKRAAWMQKQASGAPPPPAPVTPAPVTPMPPAGPVAPSAPQPGPALPAAVKPAEKKTSAAVWAIPAAILALKLL
jgi:hypothetical protein